MKLSDDQIRELLDWLVHTSKTNKKYASLREKGLKEANAWVQPETINNLTDEELKENFLKYYKRGSGDKQHLIQLNRDRIVRDVEAFRKTLLCLLDESVDIKERINQVLEGGYKIKGLGRAITTALLMDYKPEKYCLWNNKTDQGLSALGLDVYDRGATPGDNYLKALDAIKNIKDLNPDLQLTLLDVDLFLHTISAEDEGKEKLIEIIGNGSKHYLILTFKEDSPWDDKFGESYHYATTVPNYRKVQPGSEFLFVKKNVGFVGHGEIDQIEADDSQKDGPQHFRAIFKSFQSIDPPVPLSDEIKNAIVSLPGYNVQHSIKVINKDIFEKVFDSKEEAVIYWQIAPGGQARLWDDLLTNSIAAVGFSEIDQDLTGISKDDFLKIFKEAYPDFNDRKTKIKSGHLWNFISLKPGDKFVTNKGKSLILALGVIKNKYKFRPERPDYKHTIDVEYYKISESGITIPADLKGKFGKTIVPLKKNDFKKIEALFDTKQRKAWIFQANSKYYDVEAAIRELKSIRWSIRKYRDDIKTGDTVYIWQSGKKAGIIGTGKIISNPIEMGIDEIEDKFILSPDAFSDYEIRADMEIKKIFENRINKEILENHPTLNGLTILRNARGTIFPLSDEQASAIDKLVNDEGTVKPIKYTKEDALKDLFITENEFDDIMNRLSRKKNIIIQGPPGVGKTFIAKRLAYYLMTYKDENRVSMIQFHQSYSYEDFIQGFRPSEDGKFVLRDGIFYDFCSQAMKDENKPWIFIIDEINRGNLSKIFGEMLMLIEADKRGPKFAVPLTYGERSADSFYIPSNVYLIGTMNTADRSLAMVDYALRRRFSFIDLEPQFNSQLFVEYLKRNNVQEELINKIKKNMNALNETIADDTKNLGPGYKIGHSYFCPADNEQTYDEYWYKMVITSEIKPLLKEYWFDDPKRVEDHISELLA